jgi:hypothetical protein
MEEAKKKRQTSEASHEKTKEDKDNNKENIETIRIDHYSI